MDVPVVHAAVKIPISTINSIILKTSTKIGINIYIYVCVCVNFKTISNEAKRLITASHHYISHLFLIISDAGCL